MVRPLQPLSEGVVRKTSYIGFVQNIESQSKPKIRHKSELQVRQKFCDFIREEGGRAETELGTGNREKEAGASEREVRSKYEEKVKPGASGAGAGEGEEGGPTKGGAQLSPIESSEWRSEDVVMEEEKVIIEEEELANVAKNSWLIEGLQFLDKESNSFLKEDGTVSNFDRLPPLNSEQILC